MTPVSFTADAEVISIDAFVREPNGVIFGVTLVKVHEKQRPILEKCSLCHYLPTERLRPQGNLFQFVWPSLPSFSSVSLGQGGR